MTDPAQLAAGKPDYQSGNDEDHSEFYQDLSGMRHDSLFEFQRYCKYLLCQQAVFVLLPLCGTASLCSLSHLPGVRFAVISALHLADCATSGQAAI